MEKYKQVQLWRVLDEDGHKIDGGDGFLSVREARKFARTFESLWHKPRETFKVVPYSGDTLLLGHEYNDRRLAREHMFTGKALGKNVIKVDDSRTRESRFAESANWFKGRSVVVTQVPKPKKKETGDHYWATHWASKFMSPDQGLIHPYEPDYGGLVKTLGFVGARKYLTSHGVSVRKAKKLLSGTR
jgi:hypothetical protein